MLINCVAYEGGKKLADIPPSEIHEYVCKPECFVWVALFEPSREEVDAMHREFDLPDLAVEDALKSRNGDQRRALLPLFLHPNAQVRLKAATATLALAPEAARQTLQIISDRQEYPQAADARGMMRAVDKGRYVPE